MISEGDDFDNLSRVVSQNGTLHTSRHTLTPEQYKKSGTGPEMSVVGEEK